VEITATLVKELRDKTGIAMMDCKRALSETDGDVEKAIEFLRKKGALKAESKSDRMTSEGIIGSFIGANGSFGSLVEVNCETDFVAKSDDFVGLVNDIALHAAETGHLDNIQEQKFVNDASKTIGDMIKEKIAKLGENITIKRYTRFTAEANGFVGSYIHSNKKVGVLVELTGDGDLSAHKDEIASVIKDIAMHVTASKPNFVNRDEVDAGFIAKEKDILMSQPDLASKPENIREKMVTGRLEKIYAQVCLLEQPFVKNPDQTVNELLKEKNAKFGGNLSVKRFTRYSLGE
jgi:elongation factor Ts